MVCISHAVFFFFMLDEFASMPLPGFTRELATMRSRNISASTIIQNMAQIKERYKNSWETIPGNSDTLLYLGGNESSTHEYISKALGKSTIDAKTHGQTKGRSGSYSTNFQMSGRELLTPDAVRQLDNRYAILFIRGTKPVLDGKYDLTKHPAIRFTPDGGGQPYLFIGFCRWIGWKRQGIFGFRKVILWQIVRNEGIPTSSGREMGTI